MIPEQKFADHFDCTLFDLIEKADRRADEMRMLPGAREPVWDDVGHFLRQARSRVRTRMNPKDREGTA